MASQHRALEKIDMELIERVKLSPCLFDQHNPYFRLRYKKDTKWKIVAKDIGMNNFEEARRRWTVLRDRYARDLKQILLNPRCDFGHNDFFVSMDFLRPFVKKRRERKIHSTRKTIQTRQKVQENGRSSKSIVKYEYIDNEHQTIDQTEDEEESYASQSYQQYDVYDTATTQSIEIASPISAPTVVSVETKPISLISSTSDIYADEKQSSAIKVCSSDNEDPFSKVIASHLKNLSRSNKIKAQIEMMQILEKYIDIEENNC